jgi:hypothetical protein
LGSVCGHLTLVIVIITARCYYVPKRLLENLKVTGHDIFHFRNTLILSSVIDTCFRKPKIMGKSTMDAHRKRIY